jgi:drug/metabolite transporter (DMT)-like permease
MLGGLLALVSALTFTITNAAVRRGVLSGSALQATAFSIPVGIPIFLVALLIGGDPGAFARLPLRAIIAFAITGTTHFVIGRYANYRAIGAIGLNLAGPVLQFNLVVSLVLAVAFLGEVLTPLRLIGILLIFVGPVILSRDPARRAPIESFTPRRAEGYFFASIAGLCYGLTPVLLRYAGGGRGIEATLAGGVISTAVSAVAVALLLLAPGHLRDIRTVNQRAARWFLFSAVMVYVSQLLYYMALALAPVTIVAPVSSLNNVMRIHVSRWMNPRHEVFGPAVTIATILSFLGVLVLSLNADSLPLPPALIHVLGWRWPS